jgi:predicted nucleic acid-binding protein
VQSGAALVNTSCVVLEAAVLLQHRIDLPTVWDFVENVVPTLRVSWVGEELHQRGMRRLFRESRRRLGLVDCVSLEFMEAEGLRDVLAFASHFPRASSRLLPAH